MTTLKLLLVLCLFVPGSFSQNNPAPADSDITRGQAALHARDHRAALEAFKTANKKQDGKCALCYIGMGLTYMRMGNGREALEASDKAIRFASDDHLRAQAHNLKATILNAIAADDKKKQSESLSEFRNAISSDSSVALYHFNYGIALLKAEQTKEGVDELQKYLALEPEGSQAETARRFIAAPQLAGKELAPEWQLTANRGESVTSKELLGKVVVLDFWATWCPPCRESLPELKDLRKKYESKGLVLISVSADEDEKKWEDFVRSKQMDWVQYRDADGHIRDLFGVHSFPTYIVISGDGSIESRIVGLNPQQSVAYRLRDKLKSLSQLNEVANVH